MPRSVRTLHGLHHCFIASLVLLSWSKSVRCFAVLRANNGYHHHHHGRGDQESWTRSKSAATSSVMAVVQDNPSSRRQSHSVDSARTRFHHGRTCSCHSPTMKLSAVSKANTHAEDENSSNHHHSHNVRGGSASSSSAATSDTQPGVWPRGDILDRRLITIALPVIANYAINPLIGAVDLFWVSRMGNALAVAGQAAANQVFSSVFWLTSFLPSVTATLIAKEKKSGNLQGVQDAVCQALFVGQIMAVVSSILLFCRPNQILKSVLADGAPALEYAKPYLIIRALAFVPSLISLVGFSAFRGVLDTVTPVKISAFANIFNAVLDPILIFTLSMGVPGAALASLAAEVISAGIYLYLLRKRNMLQFSKLIRIPAWQQLKPLLRGGAALQLRNVSLNLTFLAVARVTQSIDQTGVAAAAHAMSIQTFQLGGIVLLALSTVAQTVVPNDMVLGYDDTLQRRVGGKPFAKATVNRLMSWGFLLGSGLAALQIALLPLITKSTPLLEVREAAVVPARLGSLLQIINGLVFIGEGVMVGTGSFLQLSLSTVVATTGCLWALHTFPSHYGLTGVWMGFGVFNVLRLGGVAIHQLVNGPLAPRNIRKEEEPTT